MEIDEFPNLSIEIIEPNKSIPIKPIPYKPIKIPEYKIPERIELPKSFKPLEPIKPSE